MENCLSCKHKQIIEYGLYGFLGETIIECGICENVNQEKCEEYENEDTINN